MNRFRKVWVAFPAMPISIGRSVVRSCTAVSRIHWMMMRMVVGTDPANYHSSPLVRSLWVWVYEYECKPQIKIQMSHYIFKVVITARNAGTGYISRWIVEMIIVIFMMIVRVVDGSSRRCRMIILIVLSWTRRTAIRCTNGAGRRRERALLVVFGYRNF